MRKEIFFFIHMHQLSKFYAKKASLTFRSRSKMHLEVSELHYVGRRQAVGSNPRYIYTLTNAHRSKGAGKRRRAASEILHPTQRQVAEVGCAWGGRPSPAGLGEDLHSSENRAVPGKGPGWLPPALPVSSVSLSFPLTHQV